MHSELTKKAMGVAMSVLGAGGGLEKLHALVKIREIVLQDETVKGTEARNKHPAFKALLESLHEVKSPDFGDVDANEAGKYNGVLSASNMVGIVASLARLLSELDGKDESEILANSDVKCIISQCRRLSY